ncbi:tRNA uridine-5-carboxymethylaminomethyl(34) synthesis GTPase MnmE [Novosphingobium piscinae]|uniref:tRNA modification GTPase MnmE n=1 Tax=Novosphingobium piscinae TaxID=1507448 RepID=A0A7X1KQT9_9SPHN|nr:tRNA uridine-5-carboxymethylaminomethyl(34) synthesis GTPase MnmE [Novosphingobium piscinae]MBC2670062.1 tRNA uridine-5-carboxymethylaminomethyl(34) synthesis GTPase MnmE [Novosphingobium piscinae]
MATIFALSSGAPPAAIGLIRISGPAASAALRQLAGRLPEPRRAVTARLRDARGDTLDRALVLWLPGPANATGEDCAELHLHGGRAVIAAVEQALLACPGLRRAEPGEFTRRAFVNGRIDLAEAEGLADLLAAETEIQRQAALAMAGGGLSRQVAQWRDELLALSAAVEATLDFADDDDVAAQADCSTWNTAGLRAALAAWLARPRAEALREGFRVVLAGPPNAGKSTLFNALVETEAAITSPIAGTTRDVVSRPVAIDGVPFLFLDTAGLRDDSADAIERIGVERAAAELARADLVLWLGPEAACPPGAWDIAAQCDRADADPKQAPRHRLSARTGAGMVDLRADLVATARAALPRPGDAALNMRQHRLLAQAEAALGRVDGQTDPLLVAEELRVARVAFDALLGRTTTEDMLDALFGRFCIGK